MALPVTPVPGGAPPVGPQGGISAPSPNPGKEAAAIAKVRQVVSQLQAIVPDVDIASPLGEAVLKAIQNLSKHAPVSQAQPGGGMQSLKDQLMKAMQGGPMAALQRAQAGAAPPPGAMAPPPPAPVE